MIQNDNPTTFVITLDISDLQADLPLFSACTSNIQAEEVVTLVDPNTLAPRIEDKEICTEPLLLGQDIVYVQEEQVETQEVPQNEIIIETTQETVGLSVEDETVPVPEEVVGTVASNLQQVQDTFGFSVPVSQTEQVVEIELAPDEGEDQQTDDTDEGMSFISDDLASLLSEDLDVDLQKAAKDALSHKSLRPIINEELKTIIQHRRVRGGKKELKMEETKKRRASYDDEEVTEETIVRKQRRRERNKVAAQKCRNRKRELTDELELETQKLMAKQERIRDEVDNLRRERENLISMLRFHDASPAARCGRTLSQGDDE